MKNKLNRFLILLPLWLGRFFTPPPIAGVQFCNIGEGTRAHGRKTYLCDAVTTARYLLYKVGSDGDHVAVCGANDVPLGSSDDMCEDVTIPITVNLFGAVEGTMRVTTDGTIANGDYVMTGANGQVTKATTGLAGICGRAVIGTDATAAAGDVITIVPVLPSKLAF